MIHVFYPLSPTRRRKAISSLQNGRSVNCHLLPKRSVILGESDTGRGQVVVHSTDLDGAEEALSWVVQQHAEVNWEAIQ